MHTRVVGGAARPSRDTMLPILTLAAVLLPAAPAASAIPATPAIPAIRAMPAPSEDALQTARELLAAGDAEAASELLGRLLDPPRPELDLRAARLLLARAHLDVGGRAQLALDVLAPIDTGEDHAVGLLLGEALRDRALETEARKGRGQDSLFLFELARTEWTRAAGRAPRGDGRAAAEASALVLEVFGDVEAAEALADDALKRHGDDPLLRLRRGTARLRRWSASEAAPDGRSTARSRKALLKKAVDDLETARDGLPEDVDAPWQLAWLHERQEDMDAAVGAAVDVLTRGGVELGGPLLVDLAARMSGAENMDAAQRALWALGDADPEFITRAVADRLADDPGLASRLQWAAVNMRGSRHGDRRTPRKVLTAIMAAEPAGAAVWNNYGYFLREAGEYEDSYAAYEKALTFDDTDPRILNDTAVLLHYYLRRDRDRAVELYERAIERAEALLDDRDLDRAVKSEATSALRDARTNLSRLRSGDLRPR